MQPLYELKIKLISACDYRCQMCGHWREPVERLSTAQVIQALRDAVTVGTRSVIFSGGEPTLHKGLVAAVSEARALGLRVTLASNGGALRPGKLEELLAAGVDQLNISLDSPLAEVHDQIRGTPGSHADIVAGLGRAAALGHRAALKTVVTAQSFETLVTLPELADTVSLQSLSLTLVTANEDHMQPLLLSQEALREYFFRVLPLILDGAARRRLPVKLYPIFRALQGLAPAQLAAELRAAAGQDYATELAAFAAGRYGAAFAGVQACPVVGGKALIRPDGGVYFCCEISHTGELCMGVLGTAAEAPVQRPPRSLPLLQAQLAPGAATDLAGIWNSARYTAVRDAGSAPVHQRCNYCTEWFSRPPEALTKRERHKGVPAEPAERRTALVDPGVRP